MSIHHETFQHVPDDHVGSGDIEAVGQGPGESPEGTGGNERPKPLWIVPTLLGVLVLIFNVFILTGPTRWIYTSQGWGGPIALTALATSIFIGVFLLAYAVVLSRSERTEPQSGSKTNADPRQGSWYLRWVGMPLALALLAPLVTVWSINYYRDLLLGSGAPKPCIELYQAALDVYKGNSKFRMPASDQDEQRCNINQVALPPAGG
jgi:hypothetical protein